MRRFVCGDDTGLGKTIETLASVANLWDQQHRPIRPMILTEKSALGQWAQEIRRFTETSRTMIVDGGPDEREATYRQFFREWSLDDPTWLITNYAKPRIDCDLLQPLIEDHRTLIVADETTRLKNPSSKTHQKLKRLMRHSDRVWGLTATLIKNDLQEGYGIFKAIYPNIFGAPHDFRDKYVRMTETFVPGRGYINQPDGHSPHHIRRFKKRIDPFYFGRAKHEVSDELPVLRTRNVHVPLDRKEWDLYQDVLQGVLELDGESKGNEIFEQLAYTQQIVDSPELVDRAVDSSKLKVFDALMDNELSNRKVIVFSQSKRMVDILHRHLEKRGWCYGLEDENEGKMFVRVTGDESDDDRNRAKSHFKGNDDTRLMLLTEAGQHAMNLQEASAIIFYDLPWSGGNYIQLVGRMLRIGSPHDSAFAIHLLAESPDGEETIDHHTYNLLQTKRDLIDKVLGSRLKEDDDSHDWDLFSTDFKQLLFQRLRESADA
jgi:SNF2 family DNA or RNA helicase